MSKPAFKRLYRFTTLPILLDILQRKKLTLLNPVSWEDRNDAEILLAYKEKRSIRNLFALCFGCGDETVHHWKTYSNGSSGCCIEFSAEELKAILDTHSGLKHGKVRYRKLADVEAKKPGISQIPFTKRLAYRCEEEYRLIYETNADISFYEIGIPLECIRRITINQQMPETVYKTIKHHLRGVTGNPESRIHRSTLYENKRWINAFKESR